MKTKNKVLLIIFAVTFSFLALEILTGEIYFEKLFRYMKVKSLEDINFIRGSSLNYKRLKEYQKKNHAFVLVLTDTSVENLENFNYLVVETKNGKKTLLMNSFLDNLYPFASLSIREGSNIEGTLVKIVGDYYLPVSLTSEGRTYRDYRFPSSDFYTLPFSGVVEKSENAKITLSSGDDLLDILPTLEIAQPKNIYIPQKDGDESLFLIRNYGEYKVIVFYSFENISDVLPTFKVFLYLKGIVLILMLLILGKLIDRGILKELQQRLNEVVSLYRGELERNSKKQEILEEKIRKFMHEVKTPLSAIIGFSELVNEEAPSEEIQIINSEGKRLLELAENTLSIDSSPTLSIDISPLDLRGVIDLALKIYEVELSTLEVKLINVHKCIVLGDSLLIKQVVFNLLKNSLEHCKKVIEIELEERDGLVYFYMRNDGNKISEDILDKIWTKFYTTSQEGGRGLGLHIVSEILTAHHSHFGVTNTASGVSFFFSLKKNP